MLSIPFTAFGQKVTTLSNAVLYSEQFEQTGITTAIDDTVYNFKNVDSVIVNGDSSPLTKEINVKQNGLLNILEITGASSTGQFAGSMVGGGAAVGISYIIYNNKTNSELDGLGYGYAMVCGAAVGGLIGNSLFTHRKGKEYRNGNYMYSFLGAFGPTLAALSLKSLMKTSDYKMIYYVWLSAPLTSSTTYYILSEPKN